MADPLASTQQSERIAGLLLIAAAAAALIAANSPLAHDYHALLEARIGTLSVHTLIADGLMAIFFLLVGLEVKREWYEGRLSTNAERRLPILAAAAGMAVPALIYLAVAGSDPQLAPRLGDPGGDRHRLRHWRAGAAWAARAAFAQAVARHHRDHRRHRRGGDHRVGLHRQPRPGRAWRGRADHAARWRQWGCSASAGLWPFLLGFAALWLAMRASGVHATIAGVVAALTIPLGRGEAAFAAQAPRARNPSLGHARGRAAVRLRQRRGGVGRRRRSPRRCRWRSCSGCSLASKLGVFGAIWLAVRTGIAPRPAGTSWPQIYGTALLCGIGFTMSLFIGALAFPGDIDRIDAAKIGTLAGLTACGTGGMGRAALVGPGRKSRGRSRRSRGTVRGRRALTGRHGSFSSSATASFARSRSSFAPLRTRSAPRSMSIPRRRCATMRR